MERESLGLINCWDWPNGKPERKDGDRFSPRIRRKVTRETQGKGLDKVRLGNEVRERGTVVMHRVDLQFTIYSNSVVMTDQSDFKIL